MRNIILLFFATTQFLLAAPPTPPAPQPQTTPPPPGLPIEDGLMLLMVLGLIYSFYKFKERLKHKKTPM